MMVAWTEGSGLRLGDRDYWEHLRETYEVNLVMVRGGKLRGRAEQ